MAWSEEVHRRRTRAAVARTRRQLKGRKVRPASEAHAAPMVLAAGAVSGLVWWVKEGQKFGVSRLPGAKWVQKQWSKRFGRKALPASARAAAGRAAEQRSGKAGSNFSFPSGSQGPAAANVPSKPSGPVPSKKKKKGKGKKK